MFLGYNNIMANLNLLAIIRTISFIWVGIEFSNLTYLYFVGYRNVKTTPIIKALQVMFFFISILMFSMAFLPTFLELNRDAHYFLVSLLPVAIIPVGMAARNFRSESLKKQTMILPDHRNEKL